MKYILMIFLIFSALRSIACQCAEEKRLLEAQMDEFANSSLIIVGNVIGISEDQRLVTVVIHEVLKGDLLQNDTILYENNIYCEPFVDSLGEWLFYGTLDNGIVKINECGLSRSLTFPERNRYFRFVPAPPELGKEMANNKSTKEKEKRGMERAKQFADAELKRELADLRNRRK